MVACGSLCETFHCRTFCKELVGAGSRCSCRLPQFWQLPQAVDARGHVALSPGPPRPINVTVRYRSRSPPRPAIGSNGDSHPIGSAATGQRHRAVPIPLSIAARDTNSVWPFSKQKIRTSSRTLTASRACLGCRAMRGMVMSFLVAEIPDAAADQFVDCASTIRCRTDGAREGATPEPEPARGPALADQTAQQGGRSLPRPHPGVGPSHGGRRTPPPRKHAAE